jgi:TorA maturation chaperone TorD
MESLKARANMYDLLASAFYRPGSGLALEIAQGAFARRMENVLAECCGAFTECCLPQDFAEKINQWASEAGGEFLVYLDTEYLRLFVTDFPTAWAPPYESFYLEKRTMGQPALDCLRTYREDGLDLSDHGEFPDHVVTQLEYLRFLCLAEQTAVEDRDPYLKEIVHNRLVGFYKMHIIRWIPQFCDRVQTYSKMPYYKEMARLLKKFILMEYRNIVGIKPERIKGVKNHETTLS